MLYKTKFIHEVHTTNSAEAVWPLQYLTHARIQITWIV